MNTVTPLKHRLLPLIAALLACVVLQLSSTPAHGADDAQADVEAHLLTRSEIEGLLAAVPELEALSEESGIDTDADIEDWGSITGLTVKGQRVLSRHGFPSAEAFGRVMQSVAMARGALEVEADDEDMRRAREELARLESQLPPDTFAAISEQMGKLFEAFDNVPSANIDLVREYADRIDAL